MITESQIDEIVTRLFDNIEFPAQPGGLYEPLRYMIRIGGKRIRPRLCLTAYFLYNNELTDEILEPAAALEDFLCLIMAGLSSGVFVFAAQKKEKALYVYGCWTLVGGALLFAFVGIVMIMVK